MKWTARIILSVFLLIFGACRDENPLGMRPEMPFVPFEVVINLTNLPYINDLSTIGGYSYIDAGVNGLILYRASQSSYIAFDRTCTHLSFDERSVIDVEVPRQFMRCQNPDCESTFDFRGDPLGGPAGWPMLQYPTSRDGNFLFIFSDLF
ncbi:MAG: hypothetical protein LAT68_03760 [Cyclobacteriaceae bacterium]|nr:hypothetical protein [Cyclobacteriaceae bacterium]MCH8515426.1 hypothetical protein [Cyclobacteriaceae bacterium]